MSEASVAERVQRFQRQGYLTLASVLTPVQVALLQEEAEAIAQRARADTVFGQDEQGSACKITRVIEQSAQLDFLLDHPAVFPIVLALMGPHIQVLGSELFKRGSTPKLCVPWHTDGGDSLGGFVWTPGNPVLQLKLQYFLTDLIVPDRGNLMVAPGSHTKVFPKGPFEGPPPGLGDACQLRVRAGDAVIFPWSLWHCVSPNLGSQVRCSITLRYGQAWCRPYDYDRLDGKSLNRMSQRQRLLFGDTGQARAPHSYYYSAEATEAERIMLGETVT